MKKQRIMALIINTIQKEYRSKTLLFLFIITIGVIFFINSTLELIFGPIINAKQDPFSEGLLALTGILDKKLLLFYTIISLWGGFLSSILGVNCVRSDFDYQVTHQLLSFPLKRGEYLMARIGGTWLLVIGYYLLSLFLAFLIFSIGKSNSSLDLNIPAAFVANSFNLLALITWGVLFSLFFSKLLSFIGVSLLAFFTTLSNSYYMNKDLEYFKNASDGMFVKLGTLLHFLFPRLGVMNHISNSFLYEKKLEVNIWWESAHFLLTFALLSFLVLWIFNRKEQF